MTLVTKRLLYEYFSLNRVKKNILLLFLFLFRSTEPEPSTYLLSTEKEQEIPEDLICGICRNIFVDAVMIPCCGSSFCDDCKFKIYLFNIKIYIYLL